MKNEELKKEIETILNKASRENESNTPDFILAEYMMQCLNAAENLINNRESWYGRSAPQDKPKEMNEPLDEKFVCLMRGDGKPLTNIQFSIRALVDLYAHECGYHKDQVFMNIGLNQAYPDSVDGIEVNGVKFYRIKESNERFALSKLRHACNVANGYLRGLGYAHSVAYKLTKEALEVK